ncbi:MAG: DUF3626 domain-containing protein [Desulfovibrio sp.]|nr:DUF3626 domain-containing protein [Desulfovibrio sp.]
MSQIKADSIIRKELASRGITESTGVFGNHTVQIGRGSPIRLDEIKSANIPFAGFTTATQIARGTEGLQKNAADALQTLHSRTGSLDAKGLLGALKAMQLQTDRLDKLDQLSEEQKMDTMWTFSATVQSLSNRELSAVYQTFCSAEMDLLQTALQHEGQTNPKAGDARATAAQLFDLQALVIKEISNRSINEQMAQNAGNPGGAAKQDDDVEAPKPLTVQFGSVGNAEKHVEELDISAANLVALTETAASSSTIRERTAAGEQKKLKARKLDNVTVKEIGDTLRKQELTMNMQTKYLLDGTNSIFKNPNSPMVNIFHLHNQGTDPKGAGYLDERNSTEELLFPEFKGHNVQADERPLYGALNIRGHKGGAITDRAGYGSSAIVLKPHVAKRATYTVNDSFVSPRINVEEKRRENFYRLLDGVNNHATRQRFGKDIPQSLINALKDPNSKERKDFEALLDKIAKFPDELADVFTLKKELPESIKAHFEGNLEQCDDMLSTFNAFLTECFGDAEATRRNMATHDNLESLVTQMDSVDGNNLARATLQNRDGARPNAVLEHVPYIEAQIQGPIVPIRDIAEIRINMGDVPNEEKAAVRVQAEAYQKETGIKVTIFDDNPDSVDDDADQITLKEQEAFNLKHIDPSELNKTIEDVISTLDEKIASLRRMHPELTQGLPKGALRLEGNALNMLADKFERAVHKQLAKAKSGTLDNLMENCFNEVALPILRLKAELLRELEKMEITGAQKTAITSWVVAAKALRTPDEMRVILKHANEQAKLFKEIAEAEPPLTPAQIFVRINALAGNFDKDIGPILESFEQQGIEIGPDDKISEQDRVSNMSLVLLQHGDPPMAGDALKKLSSRLAGPEMMAFLGQLETINRVCMDFPDSANLRLAHSFLSLNANNSCRVAGQDFPRTPSFIGGLSLVQKPVRDAIRESFPDFAEKFDATYPGYPPFPVPAHPEKMPQNEADRRKFLISVMDGYINHEKTFEKGTSVHGRNHIARAYIFANVLCNILEARGIKVDRNAVLCGIAGHDLGRKGGGSDRWEGRSADITVEAMRKMFGEDTMGEDYEQQVKDSIDAHKGQTLEAMLLNAADSLDIGRTADFDIKKFLFLLGKNGEITDREAEKIRAQLAKEADLLQRLTNPICKRRQESMDLQIKIIEAKTNAEVDHFREQFEKLQAENAAEFEKDWEVPSDQYMQRFEDVIRNNSQMFPILSKFYH